jgi:hypothetical protein
MTDAAAIRPWPRWMRAETAAAYCDEVSTGTFLRAVGLGLYPKAHDVKGKGLRWLPEELDQAIQRNVAERDERAEPLVNLV